MNLSTNLDQINKPCNCNDQTYNGRSVKLAMVILSTLQWLSYRPIKPTIAVLSNLQWSSYQTYNGCPIKPTVVVLSTLQWSFYQVYNGRPTEIEIHQFQGSSYQACYGYLTMMYKNLQWLSQRVVSRKHPIRHTQDELI